jgi:hypothetical protein
MMVVQVKIHTKATTIPSSFLDDWQTSPTHPPFPTNSDTRFSSQLTHSICDPFFVCVCVCIGFGKIHLASCFCCFYAQIQKQLFSHHNKNKFG